ncbi:MAG: xanthine dehydrogenase molybdopterin binding subunit [Terrimicrobiaceae bacterium]
MMDAATVSSFSLTINGKPVEIRDASPNENLLTFLRRSGLTGSKEGCAEGDCGACSVVLIDRDAAGRAAYRSINSCIALLPSLAGREILTVEGIGCTAAMHPVQEAMVKLYGSQCGYCTPGFVASLFEGYHRSDVTEPSRIADQLCGNLCRCTGYRSIRDAAMEVFRDRKTATVPEPSPLSALSYSAGSQHFFRPTSLEGLFQLLDSDPRAKLVAGATEISVEINKLFRDYPFLISTEAVPELQTIRRTDSHWEIGGSVTLTRIEESLAGEYPAIDHMLRLFAARQIRNRATLGGNLVTASPIGDSAPVLLILDAEVVLRSEAGERTLPLSEFFLDYRKTALRAGEVLLTIRLPRAASLPGRSVFWKVSKRREMDISIVSAAFRVDFDGETVREARLAFGGVAATPKRVVQAEAALRGRTLEESCDEVRSILAREFTPLSDARGSAEYRSALVSSLWEKFALGETSYAHDETITFSGVSSSIVTDDSRSLPHESGVGHVTGEARYVEDTALRRSMLEMWPVLSTHARACILQIDTSAAEKQSGVEAVLLAGDIPGQNNVGPARHDEPALAEGEVFYHGQVIAVVIGENKETCRRAAQLVKVDYEPLSPIIGIEQAIQADSYHTDPHRLARGDVEAALLAAPRRLSDVFEFGGQEHFYLETHATWAEVTDDGGMFVASSTQHPTEIQTIVAEVLGVSRNLVVVEAPRMGGGFGGKETQGNLWAALAALASKKTGKPVRVQLDRDLDMVISGKRHPFRAEFDIGYDEHGHLLAAKIHLVSDGGWSLDLSQPVNDRALYHLDNAYYIPQVEFTGRVAKTNTTSHTAFRGFGGPQGMLVIEEILGRIAQTLKFPPEEVRRRNLYHGEGETNTTHYGQEIENNRLASLWNQLMEQSEFLKRRDEVDEWNSGHPTVKRGLAITPVKFGISFTFTPYNQAGSLVLLYRDGSAQVNHGGTEMGQGLQTKILGVAMRELGLPAERIRVMATRTDKVPNTSATAASCGSDLNGAAVADACRILLTRLAPIAAKLLETKTGTPIRDDEVVWKDGSVCWMTDETLRIPIEQVTERAYLDRVSLAASGFYKTPIIHWDWTIGKGHPFHYFAFGAAVTEVEVDTATGMMQVRRVDILHDVGDSLNPGVDRGQIEGGFVQGMGWLTSEELLWNKDGRLLTHSASTYQIPAFSNAPMDFRVRLLQDAAQPRTIGNSKAVGEPPLMLAFSVREALRDAVAATLPPGAPVLLRSPATAEAIFRAAHPQKFV